MGVAVGVGGPQDLCASPWHFDNVTSSNIDDVLADNGGLLNVLPLTVQLKFFCRQLGWPILKPSYFLNFFGGPLLHA